MNLNYTFEYTFELWQKLYGSNFYRRRKNEQGWLSWYAGCLCNGSTKFFNELTIYENFLLIASSRKIKKQEAFDKIERILDGLGLKKYENYSPLELSKGTMQRLNNACAMIQEEKITIFDEPFSGLDPVQMKLLENVIVEFHKKEKGIYIISSHDIECLQNVCDKCLLLHNGQIREINTEEVDREKIAKILSEGE